jgi:hypothetical protein
MPVPSGPELEERHRGQDPAGTGTRRICLGVAMNDLLYIGLTIVVFAVLILLVKGVERFER